MTVSIVAASLNDGITTVTHGPLSGMPSSFARSRPQTRARTNAGSDVVRSGTRPTRYDRSIHPVRVALDGTPLLGQRTGIGEVTEGLLTALSTRDDVRPVAYALTWRGRDDLAGRVPDGVRAATTRMPARVVRELWARGAGWPRAEHWTGPVDVVHALNYVAPPAAAAVIVAVHDLTFIRYPELCTPDTLRYGGLVRRAVARGALVQTGSEFVADEIRTELGVAPDGVVVIPWGLGAVTGGRAELGTMLAGSARYVLALGTIEPRKNLPALVRAFDAVAAADPEVHLVVAGKDGWDQDQFDTAVGAAKARDRIVRIGYATAAQRRDLLAGATVFAYPTLYEGFGLPPLEAMAAGAPVVAARAGSLPEVLGDAARLVDPGDDDAIAAAISGLLDDPVARAALIARGREHAATFSWDRAADRFADLYRSVA
jgi:glycosyltransferase involved in cell wall biosynthesis